MCIQHISAVQIIVIDLKKAVSPSHPASEEFDALDFVFPEVLGGQEGVKMGTPISRVLDALLADHQFLAKTESSAHTGQGITAKFSELPLMYSDDLGRSCQLHFLQSFQCFRKL